MNLFYEVLCKERRRFSLCVFKNFQKLFWGLKANFIGILEIVEDDWGDMYFQVFKKSGLCSF